MSNADDGQSLLLEPITLGDLRNKTHGELVAEDRHLQQLETESFPLESGVRGRGHIGDGLGRPGLSFFFLCLVPLTRSTIFPSNLYKYIYIFHLTSHYPPL